ncbi:MAG: nucleotidyltransferase family protein [Gemmatimonadota bacterium]
MSRAVILARGLGTRMRRADPAATLDREQRSAADVGMKGMIPIGRPFLDYLLSALADAGIRDVCLVVGPEHDAVRGRYTREVVPRRVRVHFAVQEEPRGTADAVLAAESFDAGDGFLVMNCDNYYPVEALRALGELAGSGLAGFERASLMREGNLGAERLATFPVARSDADGSLRELVDGARGDEDLVSMNLWRFTPAIFDACRAGTPSPNGELELQDAVRWALARGERFRVIPFRAAVLDLTSRADVAFVAARLEGVEVAL